MSSATPEQTDVSPPVSHIETRDDQPVRVETTTTDPSQAKPGVWGATVEMFNKFSDDDGMTQAAALAFYVGLAIAPLLAVIVWITQLVLKYIFRADSAAAIERVMSVATSVVGSKAAEPIRDLLKPATAQAESGMSITGILSVLFLAFTASSVLAQLQASLNLIWNVKPDPKINSIITMVRKRIFSFGMLFTLLFLLMVSMMFSVAIEAAFSGKREAQQATEAAAATTSPTIKVTTATGPVTVPIIAVPGASATTSKAAIATSTSAPAAVVASPAEAEAATRAAATQLTAATQAAEEAKESRILFRGLNIVISLIVATGVFMLLFTYLPDARVPWRDTFFGAVLTAVLFIVGRSLLGWYLGRGSYETSYGAAVGSFVVLLVWVYYTSIIIFIGTEATQVYARRHGHEPKPEKHAVRTERIQQTITPVSKAK